MTSDTGIKAMAANIASNTTATTTSGTLQAYARGRGNATIAEMIVPLYFALLPFFVAASLQPGNPSCTTATECRQMANEALAREDYEQFHSLAWRVVQTSKGNDSDAMLLLARAQSLSGRAQDALVMLRRLADQGTAVVDAETSDEFRRVRALPGWPDLLQRIQSVAAAKGATKSTGVEAPKPANAAAKNAAVAKPPTSPPPTAPPPPVSSPPTVSAPSAAGKPEAVAKAGTAGAAGTIGLPSMALRKPVALAYDGVSSRFVLADDETETLKVLGQTSSSVSDLIRSRWAGRFRTTALAIDTSNGDLWVAGADADAVGGARSALHRLQLISGRLLYSIELPEELGSVTLTDLVINGNRIIALDSSGLRLVGLSSGAKTPQVLAELNGLEVPTSATAASDGTVYVSHENGIARIASGARRPTVLKPADGVDLTGFHWIRHHGGSLVGIQQRGTDGPVLVRVQLERSGAAARAIEQLDKRRTLAAVVAAGVLYYLTAEPDGSGQMLRRLELK